MSLYADCQLTHEGERAANRISRAMDQSGRDRAVEIAENEYGWERLGGGISRTAFKTTDTDDEQLRFEIPGGQDQREYVSDPGQCAIKVGTPSSSQMTTEINQWKKISGEKLTDDPWQKLRPLVAPVRDWDTAKQRWVTMPLGDTDAVTWDHVKDIEDEADKRGFFLTDLADENVAVFTDGPRVIDLGFDFKWRGYTRPERWDAHETKLENIGCRNVYLHGGRRVFRTVEWNSPIRLPGLPYMHRDSTAKWTLGGTLVRFNAYGTSIPYEVAEYEEVQDALDKTLDTPETFPAVKPDVQRQDETYVPTVGTRHIRDKGIQLGTFESFLSAWYDAYDVVFADMVPDDYGDIFDVDPPEATRPGSILDDIRDDFEQV